MCPPGAGAEPVHTGTCSTPPAQRQVDPGSTDQPNVNSPTRLPEDGAEDREHHKVEASPPEGAHSPAPAGGAAEGETETSSCNRGGEASGGP